MLLRLSRKLSSRGKATANSQQVDSVLGAQEAKNLKHHLQMMQSVYNSSCSSEGSKIWASTSTSTTITTKPCTCRLEIGIC